MVSLLHMVILLYSKFPLLPLLLRHLCPPFFLLLPLCLREECEKTEEAPSDGFLQTAPRNDVTQTKICKRREKRNRSVTDGKGNGKRMNAFRKIGHKSAPECSVGMTSCTFLIICCSLSMRQAGGG